MKERQLTEINLIKKFMKAAVTHGPGKVTCDTIDDPRIQEQSDIILKVTATAICGSDLHIYSGGIPQPRPMVLGHEFMGIVEEAGNNVQKLKPGDRVVVPFPIACGACFFCHTTYRAIAKTAIPNITDQKGACLPKKVVPYLVTPICMVVMTVARRNM